MCPLSISDLPHHSLMTSVYSIMEKHQVQLDGPTTWRQNEAQCPAFEELLNLLRDACEHSGKNQRQIRDLHRKSFTGLDHR